MRNVRKILLEKVGCRVGVGMLRSAGDPLTENKQILFVRFLVSRMLGFLVSEFLGFKKFKTYLNGFKRYLVHIAKIPFHVFL